VATISKEIGSILREEREEKQLNSATMEIDKAENLINHHDEIHSKPKKTWFLSEREKKLLKSKWNRGKGRKNSNIKHSHTHRDRKRELRL
jgi:ATP-dependent RNA helicase DDX27